jgi:hypothetical protein
MRLRRRRAQIVPRAVRLQSLAGSGLWIGGHEEIRHSTVLFKQGLDGSQGGVRGEIAHINIGFVIQSQQNESTACASITVTDTPRLRYIDPQVLAI